MITIKNLTFSYKQKLPVLSGLNILIRPNSIHGIVGLNGAGKTTLLNTIYGLIKPDSGEITYNDSKLNRKQMAFLETENYYYPYITGEEYLNIFKHLFVKSDLASWNTLFNLPLNELIDTYSTGMKKKLAILSVIRQDKPVVILDEPFNGLDMESVRILRSMLLKLKDSRTILITSHILETLTNLCDTISYLEDGKLIFSKSAEQFTDLAENIYQRVENRNKEAIARLFHLLS